MIKLTRVRLINWHYLSNETIQIKNNVLLTGQNASGKSTILDAITFILTAGDTSFNLAANEKGKRDLKGYVKCKLGVENKEYLREGDVTGHVALEFFDEAFSTSFVVGAVIDAFGDVSPVKVIFYRADNALDDKMFIGSNGVIHSTVEFRKNNPTFEYYLTKKEAKRGFRNAFGSINEDFFKLIVKALAFKPIADVKEFIYQNILEEKEIDVSSIKDAIRSYKELENTLNVIKSKITDLSEIESVYSEIISFEEKKNYYQYLMKLFDVEKIQADIKKSLHQIELLEEKKNFKQQELKNVTQEIESLTERSKEIYSILSNNEDFKAEEYLEKQITKTKQALEEVQNSLDSYIKKASNFKDIVNDIRKLSEKKIYNEIANISLNNISNFDSEKVKLQLIDIESRLGEIIGTNHQEIGRLEKEKQDVIMELNEVRVALKGLDNNKLRYNPSLVGIRNDIATGLKNVYGYDVSVHIFAELIEITDKKWADTIEIFLGNRRFDLIVEPKYFDTALDIFARIKNKYRLYGIGLVNTKQLDKFNSFDKNSLASIMTSDNVDARRYINMTSGQVIMCDHESELERYNQSITNDGLIYRAFTVRSLNPNIEKPFIGKNALGEQTEHWNKVAVEKQKEFYAVSDKINLVNKELELVSKLDFKSLIKDLDNAILATKLDATLKTLQKQKSNSNKMSVNEIEDDYNKILLTIKNTDDKKVQISQEIGGINISIGQLSENIEIYKQSLETNKLELANLSKNNILIETEAKNQYEEIKNSGNDLKNIESFKAKLALEENNYINYCDSLVTKQFKYINNYNSTLSTGLTEINKYINELDKLRKSELIKYEQKVRTAREDAEIVFKEDFLSKLRNNIMTAESEIAKINDTLSDIKFGNDSYEFIFPKSKEYSHLYDMVTTNINSDGNSIFTYDFQNKYQQQLDELFTTLSNDELNNNGAINKFTDYRTYMDYDIRIINQDNETMLYSKVFKEKSGGETQVPFYVAMIASFVRIFQHNKFGVKDTIGMILFDEVFDKMDDNRMRAMMKFIISMPVQIILACPPGKMGLLQEFTDTTLIMVRQGTRAQVMDFTKKKEEDFDVEE